MTGRWLCAGNPGKNSQNFHHAHDGEFLNAEDIALPGLFEPVPSHADGFKGQVAAVAFKTQGMKQFRSLNVAGKFSGADPQLHDFLPGISSA